jgi:rifampicin phosphotransferase
LADASYVLSSADPRCRVESNVGGKASSLAALTGAGFDVPPFCVVSCDAFRALRSKGAQDLRTAVESWISTQPPGTRFAVRSSATGEDSADNSFAGLYATLLDLSGTDAVLRGVEHCWASYDNEEATHYRNLRDAAAGAMGVVIQSLVPAEWAGVAFGVNPVNSALSEGVINAVRGLGEALVSGSVNPEEIVVAAPAGSVLSRKSPDNAPPLPDSLLRDVWDLTVRAGKHYRYPQDIEWAAAGDRVFMLQSRPITTVADVFYSRNIEPWRDNAAARPDDPDRVWTRAYADEIWAPPVSPLFYNIQNLTPSFAGYWKWHGDPGPLPPDVFKYHQAAAYADVEVVRRQYAYHPAFSRIAGILNFFPAYLQQQVRNDRWLWPGRLRRTLRFEFQQRQLRSLAHNHATLTSLWPGFIKQSDEWFDLDLDGMTLEQIAAHRAELNKVVGVVSPACGFAVAYHAHDLTFILTGLLQEWFGDGDELYALVTSGLEGSITVEESEQIWQLARMMREGDAACDASVESFWHSHRHRGASYKDLIYPRWGDDRQQLMDLIRSFVHSTGASPRQQNLAMAETRRQAQARLLASCKGLDAWRRPVLRWLFRYNEIYMSERDNHRFYFDRVWYQLRRIYRSFGRRLAAQGVLATADDVFYLGAGEVDEALRGKLDGKEAQSRTSVRKRVWHDTLRVQPPKFLVGYSQHADGARLVDGNARVGIGASPGQVTGVARIIFEARDLPKVRDGEILVTRQTDPAWSTVFSRISGLVLETGGVLAHGASLCREFNLPCVTALERATELYHDGDQIIVDGTRGRVQLMSGGVS